MVHVLEKVILKKNIRFFQKHAKNIYFCIVNVQVDDVTVVIKGQDTSVRMFGTLVNTVLQRDSWMDSAAFETAVILGGIDPTRCQSFLNTMRRISCWSHPNVALLDWVLVTVEACGVQQIYCSLSFVTWNIILSQSEDGNTLLGTSITLVFDV